MNDLLWIITGGLLMSVIALIGSITIMFKDSTLDRIVLPLVSLAAGTLLGGAFFHMIPSGMNNLDAVTCGAWLLAGFSVFLVMEQFLYWHNSHKPSIKYHKPMTYLILIGDGLHNFLGGLAISSTFLTNPQAGIIAWFAAVAHEVPQEIGDFGILVHGGWNRRQALIWNLISGLMFPIGAICAFMLSLKFEIAGLILFGAGNFVYIAASDLIPEIKSHLDIRKALLCFANFIFGICLMFYLAYKF